MFKLRLICSKSQIITLLSRKQRGKEWKSESIEWSPSASNSFEKLINILSITKKKNILSVSVPRKRRKNIQNSNPNFIFPRKLGTRQIKISNLKIILSSPTAKALTCMYVISREIQTKTKGDGREPVIFLVQKAS